MSHFARIVFMILIVSVSSCTSKPDLSKGLKITLRLSLKDAIATSANNPADSTLNIALHHAEHAASGTAEAFVDTFTSFYLAHYLGQNLAAAFYKGNATDLVQQPQEVLNRYFLKLIHNKKMRMEEVLKARAFAFYNITPENLRLDHKGELMTVYLPGVTHAQSLKSFLGYRNGVKMWAVQDMEQMSTFLMKINDMTAQDQKQAHQAIVAKANSSEDIDLAELVKENTTKEDTLQALFDIMQPAIDQDGQPTGASFIGICTIRDTAKVNGYLAQKRALAILPADLKFMWGLIPGKKTANAPLALYAIAGKPLIDESDIANVNFNYEKGRAEIMIQMTGLGAQKWSQATAANINKAIAIEIDNFVYTAPNVMSRITGGRSSITGDFTKEEGYEMTQAIGAGSFPMTFDLVKTEPFRQ